jgi:predicted transcriptional regulator
MPHKPSTIDEKGLGDDVLARHFNGETERHIAEQLGVSPGAVHRYLEKHREVKQVALKAEFLPDFPKKAEILVEITQDAAKHHLGQLVGEAEKQFNHYSERVEKNPNDEDSQKLAAYWFSQYQSAVDKFLRASGVYDKAKKEAERPSTDSAVHITVNWNGERK